MLARHALLPLLLGLAPACGAPLDEATEADDAQLEAAAAGATLTFRGNYTQAVSGKLRAGSTFQVQYDAARLPGCRGNLNGGQPAWTITGYYSVNGQAAKSFWAGGFSATGSTAPPVLRLPEGGDLALWFQITNRWGCNGWDSSYGHNYHFNVSR